jgi:hypothetical protein
MEKSETLKELATALAKAQGQIKGALKDQSNPFFKSKYADLASVVEAIRGPLTENGLSYVQIAHSLENSAAIETIILHSSGEWLSCGIMSVPVTKADAQGFGSAATYCRRYSLSAAFGVAPEDDDGNAAAKAAPKETPGQIVDQELATDGMPPEVVKALREEAKKIEADFYTIGAKAAIGSWMAFKKSAGLDEHKACWGFMDSKVRAGIKKAGEASGEGT